MKLELLLFVQYLINKFIARIPITKLRMLMFREIFSIGSASVFMLNVIVLGRRIEVGNNSVINNGTILDGRGELLIIGDNVDIGANSRIWTLTHDYESADNSVVKKKTTIRRNVWIGADTIVLPGVEIGEGAVIGAGSVVTKSVPAYCVYAGNPARFIKRRINDVRFTHKYGPNFL
jgi:acetyltransferase-like isoleucine patch superfamily enzyme